MLVNLPVKSEFGFVVNLSSVHPEVVFTARILGDHEGERDEVTAVHGPCFGYGKFGQIVGQTNALPFALSNFLWRHGQCVAQQRQPFPRFAHVEADVRLHHRYHAVTNLGLVRGAQSSKGSVVAPKGVHEQRDGGNAPVGQARLFKQHRRAVVLDQEVRNGTCFIDDINRSVDSQEFISLFEMIHPPPQGLPSHGAP